MENNKLEDEIQRIDSALEALKGVKITPPTTLSKMMDLSESTIDVLYSAGVRYLKKQDFSKAADIFFFLSIIDYRRYSIWFSLGLSEMKLGRFESALNAFAMASLTDPISPYPYLFSAECAFALNRPLEASSYLTRVKETISSLSQEEKDLVQKRINEFPQI